MSNADQSASWIHSPWLDEYDDAQSVRQSHLKQIDAPPSEAYLQAVLAAENAAIADLAAPSRLVGPHEQTWKYRWGIEEEISRLSSACRESVGTERESNLRQLRDAEAARSEFCETPEFRAAVAYALAVVDRVIEAAGNDLSPAQVATKARYAEIRASLAVLTAYPSGEGEPLAREKAVTNQVESPEERRRRLIARRAELKSSGVKAWLQQIAREENRSVSRVKQWLSPEETEDQFSLASQSAGLRRR